MLDLRPVGHVIGLLVAALGAMMLVPMAVDLLAGSGHWWAFFLSAAITCLSGSLIAIASANGADARLTARELFVLTTGVWVALPAFGALPFMLGQTDARLVDALFEAMSGITTTGATVHNGLDDMARGLLLWRSMLQWTGGIGILVVAMVFLPELRVGGMQIFRSESFETEGKVLPRAAQIAARIFWAYLFVTLACHLAYVAAGMSGFDAINHALATVSTGGFSTRDASFSAFSGGTEYVAVVFMVIVSLPFVRYVQLMAGNLAPLLRDPQVRGFLATLAVIAAIMAVHRFATSDAGGEEAFRHALFNITSVMTGTGFASTDYQLWGGFAAVVFFFTSLIGGCAGSTSCSIKIFRYQLLFASIRAQIRQIHSPHGLFTPRYDGQRVPEDVLSSVMAFFVLFVVTLGAVSVLLAMTGLDFITSVSGAAAALTNVGPGLGQTIGPAGNFSAVNDAAKWILTAAMLVGRLELLVIYTLFTPRFWRG